METKKQASGTEGDFAAAIESLAHRYPLARVEIIDRDQNYWPLQNE